MPITYCKIFYKDYTDSALSPNCASIVSSIWYEGMSSGSYNLSYNLKSHVLNYPTQLVKVKDYNLFSMSFLYVSRMYICFEYERLYIEYL
ncbi:hypothetical protein HanHA300_Chr13g0499531 [Helianthus annuus]|nr:hypothetical protein HanHA300_Chr13g0499531 [Helianthus annuus]KAJ0499272.1 hypothetical protein HanHA89_Chr13g0532271 [Helianthus annuus]KAJ0665293.1 hypothetical protein HanLR1_Chr13g0502371 [Helianthus annuus]